MSCRGVVSFAPLVEFFPPFGFEFLSIRRPMSIRLITSPYFLVRFIFTLNCCGYYVFFSQGKVDPSGWCSHSFSLFPHALRTGIRYNLNMFLRFREKAYRKFCTPVAIPHFSRISSNRECKWGVLLIYCYAAFMRGGNVLGIFEGGVRSSLYIVVIGWSFLSVFCSRFAPPLSSPPVCHGED